MTQVQRNVRAPLRSYIPVKCVHLHAYLKYKLRFGKLVAVVTENEERNLIVFECVRRTKGDGGTYRFVNEKLLNRISVPLVG